MYPFQGMKDDTRKIYNRMGDELSKRIFENRMLFSLTGSNRFISEIINISPALWQIRESLVSELKMKGNSIIAYGAGARGYMFEGMCGSSINIAAFCDGDTEKQKDTFLGYKVISPEKLKEKHMDSCVVITPDSYSNILNSLLGIGFRKDQIVILNPYMQKLVEVRYFEEFLPPPSAGEVFIDAGCFNCDTDVKFIKWMNGLKYEKIVAFEPNPKQYHICLENSKQIKDMAVYPYGLWNENIDVSFFSDKTFPTSSRIVESPENDSEKIKVVKLDDILDGNKATFIKVDVEGADLNALKGAEQTILKYRPKLALSIYHKPEDVWELPSYILSLHSDYNLYIRHYNWLSYDTVLYAF